MRASMSPAGASAASARALPRSRSASPRAVATRASTGDAAPSLLPWLARVTNDAGLESRVALADGPHGRSLVALRQLTPDEVIFNVPFSFVFAEDDFAESENASSEGDDVEVSLERLPWSAEMAMRLLETRAGVGRQDLRPWIDSLPEFVSTPPLEFTREALRECQDPLAILEAEEVRAAHERAATELRNRLDAVSSDADDLRWAAGCLHSRCFTHGPRGRHLAVPGVDMCNHSFENPTAQVRVVTSPDDCQGAAATSEIAASVSGGAAGAAGGSKETRFFQLRALEDGVEEGQEITISYGAWPNDPFFLYFGFVPDGNPNDAVALFDDFSDVETRAANLGLISSAKSETASVGEARAASGPGPGARRRLVLTREGIDPEIIRAAESLGMEDWRPLVEGRCLELLRLYDSTLKEDRMLLASGDLSDDEIVSVAYRASKKEVLLGPIVRARAREAAGRETSRD